MTASLVSLAFLTGGVGPGELILVFVVVLLLFGPRRLPEIARTIGKMANEMRRASREFQDQVMKIEDELPTKEEVASMFVEPEPPEALPPAQPLDTSVEGELVAESSAGEAAASPADEPPPESTLEPGGAPPTEPPPPQPPGEDAPKHDSAG
jgi:TatA/E family protein of Tat protein translocase